VLHTHQMKRESQEKRRADSSRRRIVFDRMAALEDKLLQLHHDDIALFERLEKHISDNFHTSDISALYQLLVSPPPVASPSASPAKPPSTVEQAPASSPATLDKRDGTPEVDEEFFMLDSDTPTTPKKAQTLPPQSLTRSVSVTSSPTTLASPSMSASVPITPQSQLERSASSIGTKSPAPSFLNSSKIDESLGFEDDIPQIDPAEQESLEWVMLDPDILNVQRYGALA